MHSASANGSKGVTEEDMDDVVRAVREICDRRKSSQIRNDQHIDNTNNIQDDYQLGEREEEQGRVDSSNNDRKDESSSRENGESSALDEIDNPQDENNNGDAESKQQDEESTGSNNSKENIKQQSDVTQDVVNSSSDVNN